MTGRTRRRLQPHAPASPSSSQKYANSICHVRRVSSLHRRRAGPLSISAVKPKSFTRQMAIYVGAVVLGLIFIAAGSAFLEWIGNTFPILRRSPETWGSYGDWAAAILPALAILVTVDLWRRDRIERSKAAAQRAMIVRLEPRESGEQNPHLWLHNLSQSVIVAESTSPTNLIQTPKTVAPYLLRIHGGVF